jgi:two-component system, cell cycle sensor histidine kinase and response regulator CckA
MNIPLHVLLVEDSEDDATLLIRELRRGGYVPTARRVDTAAAFATALETQTWDLVIADYTLPQFSGLAALKLLQDRHQDIPFLVISGIIDESLAVEAMKNGANDYVMKDNLKRLIPAVERELREAQVRRDRHLAEQALAASEAWMRSANAALIELARNAKLREGDLNAVFPAVTETAARCLGAARVGIWLALPDGERFSCHNLFTLSSNQHASGMEFAVEEYPIYLQALDDNMVLSMSDVMTDPRAVEFLAAYMPEKITSTLDAAVRLQDKLAGIIFVEHSGPKRQWRAEEEAFVSSIADMVALVLSAYEQKRTETALRKSEQKYRELFENAIDMIYTMDLDGKFTSLNKRGELLSGYTRNELLSPLAPPLIAPEYATMTSAHLARKLAGEIENTVYELEIICKDGRRLPLEINSRIIYEGDQPVGIQGIARDISERKHLEEQLRQSQKMEAIGRLAGVVAHDFNNLLTAILGYSQLLLRRLDPNSALRREVLEIEKAGQRAAALTNQLLAFSRRQVFQPQTINLNVVVTDLERMLQRVIGEDIELTTQLDPRLGSVKADPSRVEQVIMNLVVNSRDAMPKGGTLKIKTANITLAEGDLVRLPEAKPGAYVMLAVSDMGVGMDKQLQSRIFEPFFTTKEPGKGTGLGLSTVYGIVRQSEGWIEVHSEPGQGSTFRIYLPQVVEETPKQADIPVPPAHEFGGNETILLTEDDAAVRELVRRMLQLNGYTVLEAHNTQEALALCRDYVGTIALMLSDVVMPQMSGPDLAQQLKALRPQMKILFMSGYADNHLLANANHTRAMPLLEKPFTPETLTRRLREVLDSHT